MSFPARIRRLLQVAIVVFGVLGGGILAARLWLGGYVVRTVLQMAGATEIRYDAVRGTPWHFEVEGLGFRLGTQAYSARRVILDRTHWWTASLGAVQVEGAEMPVYYRPNDGAARHAGEH
jgi:hypothetical protein